MHVPPLLHPLSLSPPLLLPSNSPLLRAHLRFTSRLTRSLSPRPNSCLRFCSRCHEGGFTQRHDRRVTSESKLVTAAGQRRVDQITSSQTKTTTQQINPNSQWLSHDVKLFLAVVLVAAQDEVFTDSSASGRYATYKAFFTGEIGEVLLRNQIAEIGDTARDQPAVTRITCHVILRRIRTHAVFLRRWVFATHILYGRTKCGVYNLAA